MEKYKQDFEEKHKRKYEY